MTVYIISAIDDTQQCQNVSHTLYIAKHMSKEFHFSSKQRDIPAHYHVLSFGRWTVDLMVLAKRALFIIYQRTMSFISKNDLLEDTSGILVGCPKIEYHQVMNFFEGLKAVTDM